MKNNKLINKIIGLCMATILCMSSKGVGNVVTDTDPQAFVTRAEFEAIKNRTIAEVDAYYNNIDYAIDIAIADYLTNFDLGGGISKVLDAVYPIGTVIVGDVHPDVGTWQQVTNVNNKALYIGSTPKTALSAEAQWAKMIPITLNDVQESAHVFTGTSVYSSSTGGHTHTATITTGYNEVGWGTNQYYYGGWAERSSDTSRTWYTTTGHKHEWTPAGTVSSTEGSHTHTFSWNTDNVYKSGQTTIQPDAYIVHLWKRIA